MEKCRLRQKWGNSVDFDSLTSFRLFLHHLLGKHKSSVTEMLRHPFWIELYVELIGYITERPLIGKEVVCFFTTLCQLSFSAAEIDFLVVLWLEVVLRLENDLAPRQETSAVEKAP